MNSIRLYINVLLMLVPFAAWGSTVEADSTAAVAGAPREAAVHDSVYTQVAEERMYDRRVHRYRKNWAALIPTQLVVQNAGNMGLVSAGIGWDYGGHRQWETQLLVGFIPKYKSHRAKMTLTLKENYTPWNIALKHGWAIEPLRCGLYLNTVAGHEFWRSQPARYPAKYYRFLSTKFRLNVFVGQGVEFEIPEGRNKRMRSITAFYEISTCDLYLRNKYFDRKVRLADILGLSLGIKLLFL